MLRFAMIASVPRLPNGRPDFDPWLFRRQMADVFDVDVGDVALNISILIVARNERILTEARVTAAEVFNITVISTSSMFESCSFTIFAAKAIASAGSIAPSVQSSRLRRSKSVSRPTRAGVTV